METSRFDTKKSEGGIRQGNKNKQVHIFTYVTEKTFDAYLFQIVETKQKFISQIMTSKTPVRSAEDVDEKALSYGEIKALATGNPEILRKTELDSEVSKLKLLKQSYLSQIYDLQDKITTTYPKQIKELEEKITAYESDIEHLKQNTSPNAEDFNKMIIKGTEYTDKEQAGKVLLAICGMKQNKEDEEIGEYRGFKLMLGFDALNRDFTIRMKNKASVLVHLGSDVYGNIKRLDNGLENLPKLLEEHKAELEDIKNQLEIAKVEANKPFTKEQELKEKLKELDELNIKLNIEEKEKQVLDTSDDVENEEKREKDRNSRDNR